MATISPGVVFPVAGSQVTSTAASGTFIPTLWSSKLNAKFYTATVFGEIANTNWEGEIKNMGDKIVINNIPTLTVNDYVAGAGLTYEVPTPSTVELAVDKGKYFAFQVNDVIAYQSQPNLMDMFSNDASLQMKIKIDSTVIGHALFGPSSATATDDGPSSANMGATAGVKSGSVALGTNTAPVDVGTSPSTTLLKLLTGFSAVLDEQNVPETDRFLVIDPVTRNLLMQTNLAQAQFMGDSQSMIRNGKIGSIDRFTTYVSNNLPRGAANAGILSGDGSETLVAATHTAARRVIFAGHKSALAFASQMTKVEQVRNPNDFGDYIRGLNIYGYKVVKPEALSMAFVL